MVQQGKQNGKLLGLPAFNVARVQLPRRPQSRSDGPAMIPFETVVLSVEPCFTPLIGKEQEYVVNRPLVHVIALALFPLCRRTRSAFEATNHAPSYPLNHSANRPLPIP